MKADTLALFIVNVDKYSQNRALVAIKEDVKGVLEIDARPSASIERNINNPKGNS